MRFPLPGTLFPTMKVSSEQATQFTLTSERIVDATLDARREYIHRYERRLDPKTWRVVKRRRPRSDTPFTVYQPQRRIRAPRPAISVSCSPILIGAGEVDGTLDDIMLGVTSTNTNTMKLVMSEMFHNVADARVLTRLDLPDAAQPFNFVGFKWLVKSPSLELAGLARHRDFVFLESTGVREIDGRRFGYHLMHSVDLPCYPQLPVVLGIVRAYFSLCYIYAEDPVTKRVEVFCKGFVDARGGLAQRIIVSTAANVMMDCENAILAARRKKIDYALHNAESTSETARLSRPSSGSDDGPEEEDDDDDPPMLENTRCCSVCRTTELRRRSSLAAWGSGECAMCGDRVCGRCRHSRGSNGLSCCTRCIQGAVQMDPEAFARQVAQRSAAFLPAYLLRQRDSEPAGPQEKLRLAPIQKRQRGMTVV